MIGVASTAVECISRNSSAARTSAAQARSILARRLRPRLRPRLRQAARRCTDAPGAAAMARRSCRVGGTAARGRHGGRAGRRPVSFAHRRGGPASRKRFLSVRPGIMPRDGVERRSTLSTAVLWGQNAKYQYATAWRNIELETIITRPSPLQKRPCFHPKQFGRDCPASGE